MNGVWQDVKLPDGKSHSRRRRPLQRFIEHPRAIADRLVRYAKIVGREMSSPAPTAALARGSAIRRSLGEVPSDGRGARIASKECGDKYKYNVGGPGLVAPNVVADNLRRRISCKRPLRLLTDRQAPAVYWLWRAYRVDGRAQYRTFHIDR